jgi:superfamily II DNA or RNA helicase
MKLRPYQTEAMTKARASYAAGARSVLVVAPTGSGKTVLAAACAKSALDRGGCVLFIVPRREIVKQTVAKLEALGLDPSIVAAGLDRQRDERVTVCMAQTMVRRPADCVKPPTLVIVDEAHLAVADTYRRILERWPSARSLLLTATPCRTDGRGLGEIADQMVETTGTRQLIADGHLVPPVVWSAKTPDMKGIRKTVSGELSPKHAGAKSHGAGLRVIGGAQQSAA